MNRNLLFLLVVLIFQTFCNAQAPPPCGLGYVLVACDEADNDGFTQFDLSDINALNAAFCPLVVGSLSNISYYTSEDDANNEINAISNFASYTNITNPQTIYVSTFHAGTNTVYVRSYPIQVFGDPVENAVTDLIGCDIDADGFAEFILNSQTGSITEGLICTTVTFYDSLSDAENATNPLDGSAPYINVSNPQSIYFREENEETGNYVSGSFDLIVQLPPVIFDPTLLEICDDNNDGIATFDLTLKNDEITGGNSSLIVKYFETNADAQSSTAAINPATAYQNIESPQTLYVRVENSTSGCAEFTTLTIIVEASPTPQTPSSIALCDDIGNDGFEFFDLTIREMEIINGEANVSATYYETLDDAEIGANPIPDPTMFVNSTYYQEVYVRITNDNTGCYNLVILELKLSIQPNIDYTITSLESCDYQDGNDGYSYFNLSSKTNEILGGLDSGFFTVTYYETLADAENEVNNISPANSYYSNSTTIYARLTSDIIEVDCYDVTQFDLIVNPLPDLLLPTPLEICDDDYYNNQDGLTTFDLTLKDSEITGDNSNWSVSYFETEADAQANTATIDPANAYQNIVNPQTLHVRVEDATTGCVGFTYLTIRVNPNPTPATPDPIELCDEINTGNQTEVFDLTTNEADIMNGEVGITASYYETQEDAEAGINPISDPAAYTNTITPQVIFVRVTSGETGCYTIVEQELIVNPLPEVVAVTDYFVCEAYTDSVANFNLESKTAEVLNGQDPNTFVVTYHETLADAESATNALVSPYTNTSNPQQIFVNITNTLTGCDIATVSFIIEVQQGAIAYMPSDYVICDNIGANDGFGQFNLSETPNGDGYDYFGDLYAEILAGELPGDTYSISFYETQNDADLGMNAVPTTYQNIANPQTLYIRVDNNNSICYETTQLTLVVDQLPIINLEVSYDLCNGEVLILDSGLNGGYDFSWNTGEFTSSITVDLAGTYTLTAIDVDSGCSSTALTVVSVIDCTDSDDDGVYDDDEDENDNGDLEDDDTDDDGIPNYLDDDDDGDNVDTSIEISIASSRLSSALHPFVDTDGDLIENYLDDDDDGDNVLTINEDYNNNGDPTDDDTNMNNIPDYLDSAVALGVRDFNQFAFNIYPNPATDEVNISFSNMSNALVRINIMDLQGKVVMNKEKTINNSEMNLDVSKLSSGVYFLQVNLNSEKEIRKLIIE